MGAYMEDGRCRIDWQYDSVTNIWCNTSNPKSAFRMVKNNTARGSDIMRFRTPLMLTLLNHRLSVRRVSEFELLTPDYKLLSNILKLIM